MKSTLYHDKNAGSHSLLTLIAELDQHKAWSGDGTVRSSAYWLNW